VSTAGDLTVALGTTRAIVLATAASEATGAVAARLTTVNRALAVTIANVTIFTCGTFDIAFISTETLLADTLGLLGLLIHEAGTVPIAHIARVVLWTLCTTFFTHESFLALAGGSSHSTVLLAGSTILTTTDTAHSINSTFETTVAAHETLLTKTLGTLRSLRNALTLTGANATFLVFRTSVFATGSEESRFAFTESNLLHFIVHAFTIARANLSIRSSRATRIASLALPWGHTCAFGLAETVERALTVLAANLLAETFGTLLRAVVTDASVFAFAHGLGGCRVEEAGTCSRAADLTLVDKARAL